MSAFLRTTWLPRLLALLLLAAWGRPASAQIEHPVTWKFAATPAGADGTATLTFTAAIQGNWHVYSQFIEAGGPEPTAFAFTPGPDYELLGKVTEAPAPTKAYEEAFKMNIAYFTQRVTFSQRIRLKAAKATVKGTLTFMACNDEKCLPPQDEEFSLTVQGKPGAAPAGTIPALAPGAKAASATAAARPGALPTIPGASGSPSPTVAPPRDTAPPVIATPPVATDSPRATPPTTKAAPATATAAPAGDLAVPQSLWGIFLAGFLGGLAALFMPCIFPLLPFTVSFFLKGGDRPRVAALGVAAFYGLSIIVIYVGLGLLVTVVFGSSALNEAATNGVFNLAFFALLLVFAASFLGAFEIQLPNAWVARADTQADKGGLLGLVFMALTLALVSFSCTGPIIGTLLVEAANSGAYLGPAVGMFGFALALALPFSLFAAFPALLQSLPKSGGWLNSVKVVLGFLELALALKFLSNVDLAYHWEWLDREVYLVLWIVIFGLMGLYLLGKLRFAHDSPLEYVSVPRLLLAIVVLAFTVYLVPGLWGAPLRAVAGLLPPQHTQDFDLYTPTLAAPAPAGGAPAATTAHKYSNLFKAPLGLNAYFDYEEARAAARAAGKPVLIDFTGNACVNCRKMEASVWSDPAVLPLIRDQYVLVQLYVDDKAALPAAEQVTLPSGKVLRTIGQKWSNFQTTRYQANSQPYYVLLDPATERVLAPPQGANYEPANFVQFLNSGLAALGTR